MMNWFVDYLRELKRKELEEKTAPPPAWEGRSLAERLYGDASLQSEVLPKGEFAGKIDGDHDGLESTPSPTNAGTNKSGQTGNTQKGQQETSEVVAAGQTPYEDYTDEELARAAKVAKEWVGTPYANDGTPYSRENAQKKLGADCSGSVNKILLEAGIDSKFTPSAMVAESKYYRKLKPDEKPVPGVIGVVRGVRNGVQGGHKVMYDPEARDSKGNPANSWSAERSGFQGRNYKTFEDQYHGEMIWYRPVKVKGGKSK